MLSRKIEKLKNWLQNRKNLQLFRLQLVEDKQKTAAYRVVLISHELSATGAPLMLLSAAAAILADGGQVRVLSYLDGPLRQEFEALGIPVFSHPAFRDNAALLNEFCDDCDYAVANTVVAYPAVNLLKGVSVLWWIHEGRVIEDDYISRFRKKKIRPDLEGTLRSAKKIAVVSDYARQVVGRYNALADVLSLARKDVAAVQGFEPKIPREKIRIGMLGAVCEIKGQDIVLEALRKLPRDYRAQIELHIAGRQDNDFAQALLVGSKDMPEIFWEAPKQGNELWQFYRDNDAVLVASRDESFSLVALEACMAYRPLIVSSHVGAKFLVVSGKNGFIFENENAESLCQMIIRLVDCRDKLADMGRFSRQQYENCGTLESFRQKFLDLLKK